MRANIIATKLFLLTLLIIISASLCAQENELSITVEVEHTSERRAKDGIINITCEKESSNYLFLLYKDVPIPGTKILKESGRLNENEFKFQSLKSGIYYVCVFDENNNSVCHRVEIN